MSEFLRRLEEAVEGDRSNCSTDWTDKAMSIMVGVWAIGLTLLMMAVVVAGIVEACYCIKNPGNRPKQHIELNVRP